MLIPSLPEQGQEGQKGGPYLSLLSCAAACLWLWSRDAPRPCSRRHVSLPVPDNDLPCTNRGLSPNTASFLMVAEAFRENLQIPDCKRYRGKSTATLIPLLRMYANRYTLNHLKITVHTAPAALFPSLSYRYKSMIAWDFKPAPEGMRFLQSMAFYLLLSDGPSHS